MSDQSNTLPIQPHLERLNKSFEPANLQQKWQKIWEDASWFQAGYQGTGQSNRHHPSFAIQLPPPNVTGTLHMGHGFNQTIMDSLTRYHRMSGFNTLWIPGTDHAGIATQIVVERQLEKTNISRKDLGRKNFIAKIWEWRQESGHTICQQMSRMGDSVDWSREYFTMDDNLSRVVTDTFVRLYQEGLIYRGKRLVNWDPVLQTAVSDLEVENSEEDGYLWYIRYPLVDSNESLIVATTRPETMLGDVALMVHPEDERYLHLIGKKVHLPLSERTIVLIADDYVDRNFGTGVVKVTPAHDSNDYGVGQRHKLDQINIFTLDAKVNTNAPVAYQGLDRFEARKRIVTDLEAQGLLLETKRHKLMIPRCTRTGQVVEPMLTDQWFVAVNQASKKDPQGKSLAQKAIAAVASGAVKFVPENWVHTYNQWMNNIQDWCISRQLWWGHQIPAWYDEEGNVYVARNEEEAQKEASGKKLRRDEDVLDTWYSASLVPFSTLGWPKQQEDLDLYLPSSVLVTGYDIIFFWVARMIMMTTHFTEKVPFHHVYIHGLVRDAQGKKMSKSEGNVLDPVDLIDGVDLPTLLEKRTTGLRRPETALEIIAQTKKEFPNGIPAYGADALRFTFASLATLGRSINFDSKRCEGYRNFCNKLWNATRFVLMNCESYDCGINSKEETLSLSSQDKWITSALAQTTQVIAEAFAAYRIDLVAQNLYHFVWDEFCDWYLEIAKVQIKQGNESSQRATRHTLISTLETLLRLAHPVIPFITEELWQAVAPIAGKTGPAICIAQYPKYSEEKIDRAAIKHTVLLKNLVNACRNLRGEMNVSPATKLPLLVLAEDEQASCFIQEIGPSLQGLAKLNEVRVFNDEALWSKESGAAPTMVADKLRLALFVTIDKEAEIARLSKEMGRLDDELQKIQGKLSNQAFVTKAPKAVIDQEQKRQTDFLSQVEKIKRQLAKLR